MENKAVQEGILNLHGMQITIPCEKDLVFGRSAVCDILLQDDMVSKRHARFFFSLGRYFVEDLDSANGTRVNGDILYGSRGLVSGDEILIYPYSMQFFIQDVAPAAPSDQKAAPSKSDPSRCVHFSGRIDILSIVDLIQLLHSTTQTGVLTVTDPERRHAILHIMDGEIVAAEYGKHKQEDAVCQLVIRGAGDFEFERKKFPPPAKPMASKTVPLLFEACRLKDEASPPSHQGSETVLLRKIPEA